MIVRDPSIRKIAVLRALYLGDLLLSVPAFRALRAGFPNAEITLISLPWARDLMWRCDRYLDRFVPFGGYPGITDVPFNGEQSRRFIAEAKAYGYDLVLQMHGSGGESNPCARDLGGRVTAGYFLGPRPPYLAPAAIYPLHLPEIARCLHLTELLGCEGMETGLEFPILPSERAYARRLLGRREGPGPLIGIHPGAKSPHRRWPPEYFAALADMLVHRLGARIVVTGQPDEEAVDEMLDHMTSPALNLQGSTPLGVLGGVLASLDLLVINNTGPAHLAEAVGTPTVRILDGEEPWRWEPQDLSRHARVSGVERDGIWIWPEPDEVLEVVERALDSPPLRIRAIEATHAAR